MQSPRRSLCLLLALAACGAPPKGDDGIIHDPDAALPDAPQADAPPPPADAGSADASTACETKCGPKEFCSSLHAGTDDNCDGVVDDGCACMPGQTSPCFKGDPAYQESPGCFPGVMHCQANGTWGACEGGKHAFDDPPCYGFDPNDCHPISSPPFLTVGLKSGTGLFSNGALTESFTVTCPAGISPCPGVMGLDQFTPLQSGEYTVHYEKTVTGGAMQSCDFPLFVGAGGLRVEMEWEHDLGGSGVDLDLHLHQPGTTTPHSVDGFGTQDCGYGNCTIDDFSLGFGTPQWFPAGNVPPDPVNWYLDPVMEKNTCYYAPRGVGADWQAYAMGCHSPRLDLDNVTCDPAIVDPNSLSFCAPENINVDFMPKNQWFRISVYYYSAHGLSYDVHPSVKIFCDGAPVAELGQQGYYTPQAPVTFTPAMGGSAWWMVADVMLLEDECVKRCIVQPIYADAMALTPYLTTDTIAESSFGPPYPPLP